MAKMEGLVEVQKRLKELKAEGADANVSVLVGYTQNYALAVHEDLQARHSDGKQAKYLETPARLLGKQELPDLVRRVYKRTGSMRQALLVGGLRVQRGSQEIVPIDTSALKASAFTAVEDEADQVAGEAHGKAEAIRRNEEAASTKLAIRKKISVTRAKRIRSERRANRRNRQHKPK